MTLEGQSILEEYFTRRPEAKAGRTAKPAYLPRIPFLEDVSPETKLLDLTQKQRHPINAILRKSRLTSSQSRVIFSAISAAGGIFTGEKVIELTVKDIRQRSDEDLAKLPRVSNGRIAILRALFGPKEEIL